MSEVTLEGTAGDTNGAMTEVKVAAPKEASADVTTVTTKVAITNEAPT